MTHYKAEPLEFEYEYSVACLNEFGEIIHIYSVEADDEVSAKLVAEEACRDDYIDSNFYEAEILEAERIG